MDIVVVRLQSHGNRYELPCHRQKLEEYIRRGRAHPPESSARIVAQPSVFTNCHRKELATNSSLQAAFQTTSFDLIAPTILQFGEIIANEKDRQEKKNERKELQETVHKLTRTLLIGKFTGVPPEESELRDELKSAKEARCVEHVDPLLQAAYFASIVVRRERLDCLRVSKRVRVTYNVALEGEWNDFLLDFDGLVVSRKKALISTAIEFDQESSSGAMVELLLLIDAALDQPPHPRWCAMLQGCEKVDLPLQTDDVDHFSKYEFVLPEPETPNEVDLTNRLQALEKIQRDPQMDEDTSRSPNKTKKGRRHTSQILESGDEEEPPTVITSVAVSKYDVMTHKQLQDLCRQHKLSTGGKKNDLIERLEAFDEVNKPKLRH